MKAIYSYLTLAVICTAVLAGCGGSKQVAQAPQANASNEQEISVPFSDPEKYSSNTEYFRAVANAISPDMSVAKSEAANIARTEIAGYIETFVKASNKRYIGQYSKNVTPDLEGKFNEESLNMVKQSLSAAVIKEFKYFQQQDTKNYRCYVFMEMPQEAIGKSLAKQMENRLSQETKDRIDFNEHQYRQTMQAEWEEFNKDRN